MEREQSPNEEAFLELDDTSSGDGAAARDPTPELPIVPEGESFLEVLDEAVGGASARGRVVSDDDLRMVTALADDGVPLLAALWPSALDLLAHSAAHLVGPARLAAHPVGMPACLNDRVATDLKPRPGENPLLHRLLGI